uniref:Uncharacterized protein n=2 Tax=Oryza TaxID=4527 RepID=A0A0D3EX18_9ORYZ
MTSRTWLPTRYPQPTKPNQPTHLFSSLLFFPFSFLPSCSLSFPFPFSASPPRLLRSSSSSSPAALLCVLPEASYPLLLYLFNIH